MIQGICESGRVYSHFSRACLGGVEYAAGLNLILLQEVAKACTAVDKNLSVIIAGVEFGAEIVPIINTGLRIDFPAESSVLRTLG